MKIYIATLVLVVGVTVAFLMTMGGAAPERGQGDETPTPSETPTPAAMLYIPMLAQATPAPPAAWERAPLPTGNPLVWWSYLAYDDVWGVDGQNVLRWNGVEWIVQAPGKGNSQQIKMVSDTDGWLSRGLAGVERWNGQSWTPSLSLPDQDYIAIDAANGFAWTYSKGPVLGRLEGPEQSGNSFYQWDGQGWVAKPASGARLCDQLTLQWKPNIGVTIRGVLCYSEWGIWSHCHIENYAWNGGDRWAPYYRD